MPEIGEQSPLNPLYPVNPSRKPQKRERPGLPEDQKKKKRPGKQDGDDSKPHIDEYA